MADFSKYSNYTEETAFSSVVFGANAPVLEVELNEMQQILSNKMVTFFKSFSNMLIPLSEDSLSWKRTKVVEENGIPITIQGPLIYIKDCIAVCNGRVFYIKNDEFHVATDFPRNTLMLGVDEVEVTHATILRPYGAVNDLNLPTIKNPIKDSRSPGETTRRKVIRHKFLASADKEFPQSFEGFESKDIINFGKLIYDESIGRLENIEFVNIGRPATTLDLQDFQPLSGGLLPATVE